MKNIFKYQLQFSVCQSIYAPIAQVLDIQIQNGKPCLWAIVDDNHTAAHHTIYCLGTGTSDVDYTKNLDLVYISTTQLGGYVWHWFVENAEPATPQPKGGMPDEQAEQETPSE